MTALPLTGAVLTGMMPWGGESSSGSGALLAGVAESAALGVGVEDAEVVAMCEVTLTAMRPGMMTRKGKNILGMAAIRGTLRAETSEPAAMARWMTRKSVHQ